MYSGGSLWRLLFFKSFSASAAASWGDGAVAYPHTPGDDGEYTTHSKLPLPSITASHSTTTPTGNDAVAGALMMESRQAK